MQQSFLIFEIISLQSFNINKHISNNISYLFIPIDTAPPITLYLLDGG